MLLRGKKILKLALNQIDEKIANESVIRDEIITDNRSQPQADLLMCHRKVNENFRQLEEPIDKNDSSLFDFPDSGNEYKPSNSESSSSEDEITSVLSGRNALSVVTAVTPPNSGTEAQGINVVENVNSTPKSNKPNVRKRKRDELNWISRISKTAYNKGLTHVNERGQPIKGRQMRPPCTSCQNKCSDKITNTDREFLFNQFWSLGERYRQWNFIIQYTEQKVKIRAKCAANRQRGGNREYFLLASSGNSSLIRQKVCKLMFLNTLDINSQWITTEYEKKQSGSGVLDIDRRGKHERSEDIRKLAMFNTICEHINSFPCVDAHYCRQKSNKKYLEGNLTVAKMYRLFVEFMEASSIEHSVTERQYRDTFNQNFNLGFFVPKKDQCDQCIGFDNLSPEEKEQNKLIQDRHLSNKIESRKIKEIEKLEAQQSEGKIVSAVFDFQKILTVPQSRASVFYYKRKYFVYNFTVYSMNSNTGFCFVWHETLGKRGGTEVASCLKQFIELHPTCKDFRFWSDNCPGQNRNKILYTFYAWASKNYNINISHTYLEKGHTQNEGDSVHSCIERVAKNQEICVPEQWYQLIRCAKVKPPAYKVIEMNFGDFIDFKTPSNHFNFTKNINGEKFCTSKMKQLFIDRNNPQHLKYKYAFEEPYRIIALVKDIKSRGRNLTKSTNLCFELKQAYNSLHPITEAKYKDLVDLCNRKSINSAYHNFYRNLPHSSDNLEASDDE